jgi:hypothetical protein
VNKVVEISAIHPYRLKVRFSDGASGVHDYSALVNETGPMIEPLRDLDYFARVFLDYGARHGRTVLTSVLTGCGWKWNGRANWFGRRSRAFSADALARSGFPTGLLAFDLPPFRMA